MVVVVVLIVVNISFSCYILPNHDNIPVFISFFLPGLIIVSANGVIFFFIAREIHDTLKSAPVADKKEKSRELKVYISIFVSIGLSWILVPTLQQHYHLSAQCSCQPFCAVGDHSQMF